MWLRIQHFLQSSDYLSASTTCRALRSFLYPIIFRQMSISLAPLPSSASLDALVNSPVPQYVHTLRIARDPRSRDTAWLVQKATVPSFQRLFRRLINVRNIVLMDINMSHPSYLFEWMLKNKCLECVTFKGLNEGKFPKDFWSQLSPSLQVSVHCGPLGDKQAHFLDAAPITRLRTTWSHLFALMESSNGPSFDRLTVLSITMHKSLLEVLWVLRYLPTLQKLLLRGPITYQHVNHSQDQLDELTEMAKTALPHLQEVTTTSSDFLTTLLLDKRPLRRVECQGISNDIYNFIFNLLRTAHLTVETLGFQCTPEEFELLEKVRLFKSLRCLYVTLMPHSWSVSGFTLGANSIHLKRNHHSRLASPHHTRDLPTATRNTHRTTHSVYPFRLFHQPRIQSRSVRAPRAVVQTLATPPICHAPPSSGSRHIQPQFSKTVVVPVHPCGRTRVGDPRTQPTALEGGMSSYFAAQWLCHWPKDS